MSFTHTTSSQEAAMFATLAVILAVAHAAEECGCTSTRTTIAFHGEDGSTWEGVRTARAAVCGEHGGVPAGALAQWEAELLASV